MYKIMVIEDSNEIRNEIIVLLHKNGFDGYAPKLFDTIISDIRATNPHLILLDIQLPHRDGFQLCTEIRTFSRVPIIFVTSRDTDMDELMCMTLGADDYISKPYNTSILVARISALLKRTYNNSSQDHLKHGPITLDLATSRLEVEGQIVELTKNELKIMHYLFLHKERIVSRLDLVEYLWDNELFVDDNSLSVNINRIRNKLQPLGLEDFVKTKRGQGYLI
ncbi:response regulator transcription factor [Paenibacillus glacialis]|uniref:DNA-binding response regulator n=1 Tax=Paenibacillus glacialis TaxID=494026 RepID=A0A168KGX3_9BACL|nr:response regulator transcription factor [Paenibacillus glacialis]OAB41991.1 DNA-binding response regulator [Paenibacillus glacialis]